MRFSINVAANGRLTLPAEILTHLGVANGGLVQAEITDDGIILRPADNVVAKGQAIAEKYAKRPGASSAAFTTNRITESGE
jgi:bifunctional DNA-binding transcriptional regulator/antitoxin component of YhaV-PrlF toxin-antitoxin module